MDVGECWRVRNLLTGNHLIPRYCATNEARQLVNVSQTADKVKLELHYASNELIHNANVSRRRVNIITVPESADQPSAGDKSSVTVGETVVGTIAQGGVLSIAARRGQIFKAVTVDHDGRAGHEVKRWFSSGEAEQLVHIGERAIDIVIVSPSNAHGTRHIYRVPIPYVLDWGDERWIVREAAGRNRLVSTFVATTAKPHRFYTAGLLPRLHAYSHQIIHLPY